MKDYYYILGISETASIDEIKSAYRKLSVKFHPDKNDGDEFFANRFKEINEAYEILGNHIKKSGYDQGRLNKTIGSSNFTPEIEFFRTSKKEIEFNDEVTFYWRTINADKVTLRPFGIVQAIGQKTYKIKDFKNSELSFELIAENTNIDRKVISIIKLKNNTYVELYQNIKNKIESEQEASLSKKIGGKKGHRKTVSLIILLLLIVAFITNPDFDRHKEAIAKTFLSPDATKKVLNSYVYKSSIFTYEDYFILSTVSFQHQVISIGRFGGVVIPSNVKNEFRKEIGY